MNVFKPFAVLQGMVYFTYRPKDPRSNNYCAIIDGCIFAAESIHRALPQAYRLEKEEKFKNSVYLKLASCSSDVILRTKCKCERREVLPDEKSLGAYIVPLLPEMALPDLDQMDAHVTVQSRLFKWKGQYAENGFKILEEQ